MPLTLNVGLSRKTGEANYGSRGASVNLQLELECSLVNDSSRLRDSVRRLFGLAREAVDEVMREAVAAGAQIQKRPEQASWGGYSGYFRDPDGFLWEVAWNPFL